MSMEVIVKQFEYDAIIRENPDTGGAYVTFPWDIREEFGKGRVKVNATFDGIEYAGSIVNMGVKRRFLLSWDRFACWGFGL